MKIALCLSGQSRFVEEGYKSFSKNLIGFENFDIFVHSWEDNEYQKVLDLYNITNHIIEPQRYDIIFDEDNVDYSQKDAGSGNFVHYSMFYSIWKSSQLKQIYEKTHNFKYDCVIKSRFDVALFDKLDVMNQNLNYINSPDVCGNPNVISDWFNFSNSDNMDVYLDVYHNMPQYKSDGVIMTAGEELFSHHYKKNALEIKKIACNLCLIRNNETSIPYWVSVEKIGNIL